MTDGDGPKTKDWHTDAERLAFAIHRALVHMGGYQEGYLDDLLGSDWASGIEPDSPSGYNAALLLRAYKALYGLTGGDTENMQHWMQTLNRETGGTPASQVQSTIGLEVVVNYLEAVPER